MGLSIEPCARLGAETIGRPLGGEGLTVCGQECCDGWIPLSGRRGGNGRSAQIAVVRCGVGDLILARSEIILS